MSDRTADDAGHDAQVTLLRELRERWSGFNMAVEAFKPGIEWLIEEVERLRSAPSPSADLLNDAYDLLRFGGLHPTTDQLLWENARKDWVTAYEASDGAGHTDVEQGRGEASPGSVLMSSAGAPEPLTTDPSPAPPSSDLPVPTGLEPEGTTFKEPPENLNPSADLSSAACSWLSNEPITCQVHGGRWGLGNERCDKATADFHSADGLANEPHRCPNGHDFVRNWGAPICPTCSETGSPVAAPIPSAEPMWVQRPLANKSKGYYYVRATPEQVQAACPTTGHGALLEAVDELIKPHVVMTMTGRYEVMLDRIDRVRRAYLALTADKAGHDG